MKAAVEMIEAIRYKLPMLGLPLDGPASIFLTMKLSIRILQYLNGHWVRIIIILCIIEI